MLSYRKRDVVRGQRPTEQGLTEFLYPRLSSFDVLFGTLAEANFALNYFFSNNMTYFCQLSRYGLHDKYLTRGAAHVQSIQKDERHWQAGGV
mgnify:FL=1|tara:strand:+ start:128 stop:403 length:276 start_codon:yes stop_codon:yes gene_type:complete